MKKILILFVALSTLSLAGEYDNGTYRGVFVSGQETQVEVEFKLKDDKIESPKFRTLFYNGKNYLKESTLSNTKMQYEALLKAITNKNVEDGMKMLYKPGEIELAGATVRATKVRAAIKNALNSGVYTPAK